jgi:hypothetical protein
MKKSRAPFGKSDLRRSLPILSLGQVQKGTVSQKWLNGKVLKNFIGTRGMYHLYPFSSCSTLNSMMAISIHRGVSHTAHFRFFLFLFFVLPLAICSTPVVSSTSKLEPESFSSSGSARDVATSSPSAVAFNGGVRTLPTTLR